MKKSNLLIILFFIIVIFLVIFIPELSSNYVKASKLYINEVMANNGSTIKDNDGEYSDYIEIYNGFNRDINLKDYHLSDSEFETQKWTFPNVTVKAKSYLLVYASGKDYCINDICHTNFKLSSKGEVLTLSDKNNQIISKITYGKMERDISYGYVKRKYVYLAKPTPGSKNNNEVYKQNKGNYKLIITEYMTHNKSFNYDSNGYYYDWVEIYNNGKKTINLSSVYLTDDLKKLDKYRLPDIDLEKGSYIIIYLSGQVGFNGKEIYADFKLSTDEDLAIVNNGKVLDKVKVKELPNNISYGKVDDEWYYFATPTPGRKNDTAALKSLGGNFDGA